MKPTPPMSDGPDPEYDKWRESLGAQRIMEIPNDRTDIALEDIANSLRTLCKPRAPQELVAEHGSMTAKFGELCRIMYGMGHNLTKVLDGELAVDALERAQFLRKLAEDLTRYGEENLKVFRLHQQSHDEVASAIREAMKP